MMPAPAMLQNRHSLSVLLGVTAVLLVGCSPFTPVLPTTTQPTAGTLGPHATAGPVPTTTLRPSVAASPSLLPPPSPSPLPPTSTPPAPVTLELAGQIGGTAQGVIIQKDYLYMGVGPRVVAVDVSDPVDPQVVGQSAVLPGLVHALDVQGPYGYVGVALDAYLPDMESSQVVVLELSDPAAPLVVARSAVFSHTVQSLVVRNEHLYLAVGRYYCWGAECPGGLRVLDVADPTAPYEVGFLSLPGGAVSVALAGDYAYVGTPGEGLRVIDITDPAQSHQIGASEEKWAVVDLAVIDERAYLATGATVQIVDISTPASPRPLGAYESPDGLEIWSLAGQDPAELVLVEEVCPEACLTNLRVIDVRDPGQPREVGFRDMPDPVSGLAVAGRYAYYVTWWAGTVGGLQVLDLGQPDTLEQVGQVPAIDSALDVVLADGSLYLLSRTGLHRFEVSDPVHPQVRAAFPVALFRGSLAVAAGQAFLTAADLYIVDVTDDAMPRLGQFSLLWDWWEDGQVAVAGGYAYVWAWATDSLWVVDITDPAAAERVAALPFGIGTVGMALSGDHAYLATLNCGLVVVDISEPAEPRVAAESFPAGCAGEGDIWQAGLEVQGNLAYVAVQGLRIVDVGDPFHPQEIGRLNAGWTAEDVALAGGYAYVVTRRDGLRVIDVADPTRPVEVGSYGTPGQGGVWSPGDIAALGGHLYVAAGPLGLLILRAAPSR